MKKTLFFKKSLAILLTLTMTVGNIGFVRANQLIIDKTMLETQAGETATGEQTESTETLSNEDSEQKENKQLQDENEIEDTSNLQVIDTTKTDDNQLNNEIVLPKAINDKFKVYMDDSYKANMPVSRSRSFPLIIEKPNMKLTIDQNSASLLSSDRFDQLVNEIDEIIRLSKEFIGLDKNIIIPIEINSDTNGSISYPDLLISGGAFKEIVETEINAGRMDSIVYYLNGFVIEYASSNLIGNNNFWNNYINNFDKLMSAYCVESMNLTMKELSYVYDREDFTGKDYKNVFLWQYNRVMNSPIEDLYMDDIIWSSPYTLLRIKEEVGWEAFKVASNEILEQSKTSRYPYEVNYNNFLDALANSSKKSIYNMLTAKEVETYEALLGVKLSGNYEGISLKGKGTVDEPYQIENPQDFSEIENAMSANFVLSKNIDMKDFVFTPIGTKNKEAFKGTLDGKGFIIQNFNINNDELDVVSMFYKTEGAKLTNLIFDSVTLSTNNVNSITALLAGIALNTEIERCLVIDLNITSKSKLVGGIIGEAENVNISQAEIYGYITTEDTLAAGIAATAKNTNIENCSVISNIKSNNKVAGFVSEATDVNVTTSYSYSKLDAPNKLGLIEKNSTNSINDSYYNKTVAKINEDSDDAKTTEQFSTGDLFENWSIASSKQKSILIWVIVAVTTVFGIVYFATNSWYNDIVASANGDAAIKDLEDKIQKYIEKEFTPEKETKNQIEIVFLVDTSKQMSNTRLSVAKTMIGELSEKLYDRNDVKMGLIDFSSGTTWRNRINDDKVEFKQHLAEISDTIDNNNPRAYDAINKGVSGFHGVYTNMSYSFTPYTSKDDGIDRHIILFTSSKTTEADLLHKHVLEVLLKFGIYVHIVNIPEKENQLLSYFKELSEKTDGLIRNINVGVDENKLEQDKAKAINDLRIKILGDEDVKEVKGIQGVLLFTGHYWTNTDYYPNVEKYEKDDQNKDTEVKLDSLVDPSQKSYLPAQDYIITCGGGVLYNKYTDAQGLEHTITYTQEDKEDLERKSLKSTKSKIYYNDSYLAVTGEPLFENSNDIEHDFTKLSQDFIDNLMDENHVINGKNSRSLGQTEGTIKEGEKDEIKVDLIVGGSLNELVDINYKTLAKNILKYNPDANLWFALPGNMNFLPLGSQFIEPYKKYVIDSVEQAMKELESELDISNIWENNVRGFYFGYENMTDYEYHNFDYNFVEHYENRIIGQELTLTEGSRRNKVLELSVAMSDYVHSKGKKLLWIPHYQNLAKNNQASLPFYDDIVLSLIGNSTDIFDYITIQPNTFWASERGKNNVGIVKSNIENNVVLAYKYDRNIDYYEPENLEMVIVDKNNAQQLAELRLKNDITTTITNGIKTSNTIIGVEYELDGRITEQIYKANYTKYNVFNAFKNIPYTIYADKASVILDEINVTEEVKRLLELNK